MTHNEPLADLDRTQVGNVENYYGGLWIKCKNGSPYWAIENWDGFNWKPCPRDVFVALAVLARRPTLNEVCAEQMLKKDVDAAREALK